MTDVATEGRAGGAALGSSAVRDRLETLAERPRLATAEEVADAIGLPTASVYKLAREDRLPSITFGRMRRFDAGAVLAFLAAGGTPFEKDAEEEEAVEAGAER